MKENTIDYQPGLKVKRLLQKGRWERKLSPALRASGFQNADDNQPIIVELSGKETDEIISIIQSNHGKLRRDMNILSALAAEVPVAAIPILAMSKQVKKIWLDNSIKTCQEWYRLTTMKNEVRLPWI